MGRFIPGLLVLATALALNPAVSRAGYFTIESFHADIGVGTDSVLEVREEITVLFTRPRHGIFRNLPYRYTTDIGGEHRTPLSVEAVTDGDGESRPFRLEKSGGTLRIRIGHRKKYVRGRQVYVITYRVKNALLYLDDEDELYWNITGTEWPTVIESASADVTLPRPSAYSSLSLSCYTGPYGATGGSCSSRTDGERAFFATDKPLAAGEGLTIAVGWPKGLAKEPAGLQRLFWRFAPEETWVFLVPLLALAALFRMWFKFGRDPEARPVEAVVYGPPKHRGRPLSPAEVGSLVDERLDGRDLTAAVVGLAVKGYLTIEEKDVQGIIFSSRDFFLKQVKEPDGELDPFEQRLMKDLFHAFPAGILVSDLKNSFYRHLEGLRRELFAQLLEKGFFLSSPEGVRRTYRSRAVVLAIAGFAAAWLIPFLFPLTVTWMNVVAFTIPGLLMFLIAPHMPARTREGTLATGRVRGFQEFLMRAEKDRLERMKDLNLFEKMLPYAIALGVSDRWASAFEGIDQEPPQWYVTPGALDAGFHPGLFNETLGSALAGMRSGMYAAPRSSGGGGGGFSSGGGFSGGGFGGGGGGSW